MFLFQWLGDWLKGLLIDGIMGNLTGLFDGVNQQVGEIAGMVGQTPGNFNPGVFNLVRSISETVVLPIAGLLLTFVMTWELIQLIIDSNNMHQADTWIFFKWIFKTMIAVMILTNTFPIVIAVFDVAQTVINSASGIITGSTVVTAGMEVGLRMRLEAMGFGEVLGLWFQSMFVGIIVVAMQIVILVIVYGRMIEIYLLTSLAPLPMATMTNREFSGMGHNYLKSLLAVGFQGLLIMVCVGIYAVMVQNIAISADIFGAIWLAVGYTVLLCFTLFKTGSIAKSIFSAQ